jgi:Protein of unknown function (DUF664)
VIEPDESGAGLVAALRGKGEHIRTVVQETDLSAVAAPGPRWDRADPASLERVLFHLLRE